jgi:hypothetical protein
MPSFSQTGFKAPTIFLHTSALSIVDLLCTTIVDLLCTILQPSRQKSTGFFDEMSDYF